MKVKVKVKVKAIIEKGTKAQGGVDYSPTFNLEAIWGWGVVNATPRSLYSPGKDPVPTV